MNVCTELENNNFLDKQNLNKIYGKYYFLKVHQE